MAAPFVLAFYERMGMGAYATGKLDKAESWFRKIEAVEPDSIRVLRNIGLVLLAKGDAEGARTYIAREEKRYGASFHRHAALGDIAYAAGNRREAERRYRLALEDRECGPEGHNRHLRPLLELRIGICANPVRFESSRESMRLFTEGTTRSTKGDYEGAVKVWLEAAKLDDSNWPALNNAARLLLEKLHRPEEAQDLFRRAFELSRSVQVARNLELAGNRTKHRKP